MIIESILTTRDAADRTNFAPMGVVWGEDRITIRPYRETTTFRNLLATGEAVVNLTDDVFCFARAALGTAEFPAVPAEVVNGVVLRDGCSWRELRVEEADTREPRGRFTCAVVHRGTRREFLGFNRARNAVLEATILATRTRLLPIQEILAEMERLQTLVDKTAGPREKEAMDFVFAYVRAEAEAPRPR